MLGIRKKKAELIDRRIEALKAEKEAMSQIIDEADEEYRKMQLQIWALQTKLMQERQDRLGLERRLREELLKQVREILECIDRGQSITVGNTRCFLDSDTVTWKVVTDESEEPVAFNSAEGARFYYVLYQAFKMRPEVRESMECYLEHIKKSA